MRYLCQTIAAATLLTTALAAAQPDIQSVCNAFPDLKGWQTRQCDGLKMADPVNGGDILMISEVYTRGDQALNLSIVTGSRAMMMWGPYASGTTMENDRVSMKKETIDGFSVGITYDKKEHAGAVIVQLTPSALLVLSFEELSPEEAMKLAKEADWKKLQSLFQ